MALNGAEVVSARGIQQGERCLDQGEWDLVLCAATLPHGPGTRLARWIREERPGLEARLVFTADGPSPDERQGAWRLEGTPVLSKPLDPAGLRALARSLNDDPQMVMPPSTSMQRPVK